MVAKELVKTLKTREKPLVLDVRSKFEFYTGRIPGAVHAPFWAMLFKSRGRLPQDKKSLLVLTCEHGPRAQMAKSLLGLLGFCNVDLLEGHMAGWRRAGLPLER